VKLNMEEAFRYLGVSVPSEQMRSDMAIVAEKLMAAVQPRYAYRVFSLERRSQGMYLTEADICLPGRDAEKMLAQCDKVALLACTLGAQFDALLRTEQVRDMARAVMLNACGSAWVEAGCDQAERELAAQMPGRFLTDRFSPGYGDLPLTLQPNICSALDTMRRLGLYATEHFLLNPTKSVTAVIGLSDQPQMARIRGCDHCSMRETCTLRQGGTCCAN